jgi:VanZ family protein
VTTSTLLSILRRALPVLFLGWVGVIFYFSTLPGPKIEELNVLTLNDKLLHFLAFAVGGSLLFLSLLLNTPWSNRRAGWTAFWITTAYGAFDEWHQLFTPNRAGADPLDWLADTIGAGAGIAATIALVCWLRHWPCCNPTALSAKKPEVIPEPPPTETLPQ